MRKSYTPSKLFGLKQQDMAILLGVSRAHYGMYESGLRPIPIKAALLLTEMIAHFHSPETTAKATSHAAFQQNGVKKALEEMLRDNEYEQRQLQKKMDSITKKHAAAQAQLPLAEFFASRANANKLKIESAAEMLAARAQKILKGEHLAALVKLELKLETLQLEKLLIQSKLQKITKTLENTDSPQDNSHND